METSAASHLRSDNKERNISGASMSIRIRHLEIPDAVRAGNEAKLTCDYDLKVGKTNRNEMKAIN